MKAALKFLAALAIIWLPLAPDAFAQAQPGTARVVAACGTQTYPAGSSQPVTQNPAGSGCINGSFSATVAVFPLTSTNLSSTISVTNTFQSIQVSTAGRNGCLIQNQSTTDPMWVYFGAIGGATKAKSFELDSTHGLAISCSVGGLGVLTDQVSITWTSTDGFTANFQ